MKHKIIGIACTIIFSIIVTNASAQTNEKIKLLTSIKWQRAGWTVDPAYQMRGNWPVTTDLWEYESACLKEDYYVFAEDGNYKIINESNDCPGKNIGFSGVGKWKMNPKTNKLYLGDEKKGYSTRDVLEITATKLVLTIFTIQKGVKYTFTETYKPKINYN